MELNANSVRNGLKRAGFKVVKSVGSVRLLWARHTGDKLWTQLPRGAIVNHFPGSWVLGRKDGLAKSLHAQQRRLGALGMGEAYSFFPRTFILPQDRPSLERAVERGVLRGGGTLIVKPQNSSRGRGIRLVSSVAEVPPEERLLVQEYIDQPMLLEGKKFDIRLYVLVTSYDPLRCYVYEQGLTRLASQPYEAVGAEGSYDRFAHLTNYSICKKDEAYVRNTDADADAEGCKWSLAALWRTLEAQGADVPALRAKVHAICLRTLIATQPHVCSRYGQYFRRRGACFEVFGFDVLLDSALTPYLIEVNVSPDLASTSPLDKVLKHRLAADMLHVVGVRPPFKPPPAAETPVGGAAGGGGGSSGGGSAAAAGVEPPLLSRAMTGREPSQLNGVPLRELSDAELECIVEAEEEWWRAEQTDWHCLYPAAPGAVASAFPLFAQPKYADCLLAAYLQRPHGRAELEALLPMAGAACSGAADEWMGAPHQPPPQGGVAGAPLGAVLSSRALQAGSARGGAPAAAASAPACSRRLAGSTRPANRLGAPLRGYANPPPTR